MTKIKNILKYLIASVKRMWYDLDNRRVKKRTMKDNKKGILEAKDLACYIKKEYEKYTQGSRKITPIKMQKALYFCFAYWAGFVNKGKIDKQISNDENEVLFNDRIEAWSFGPVVPNVYFNERDAMLFRKKSQEDEAVKKVEVIFEQNPILAETINSLLQDLFQISDFKLVSRSHMDKAWQNHFNPTASKHNETIPKEEIINEYTTKEFN